MAIPTEPIGSIPRPRELLEAIEAFQSGSGSQQDLAARFDDDAKCIGPHLAQQGIEGRAHVANERVAERNSGEFFLEKQRRERISVQEPLHRLCHFGRGSLHRAMNRWCLLQVADWMGLIVQAAF